MRHRWYALALAGLLSLGIASSGQAWRLRLPPPEKVELTPEQRREIEEIACLGPHQVTMRQAIGSKGARGLVANVTCNAHATVESRPVSFELWCHLDLDDQPGWSCNVLWESIHARFGRRDVFIEPEYRYVPAMNAYQAVADVIAAGDLLPREALKGGDPLTCSVSDSLAPEGSSLAVFCGGSIGVGVKQDASSRKLRYVKVEAFVMIE